MLKFKHYVQGDNDEKNGYGNDFFTRMAQFTGMISIVVVVLLVGSLFFTANRISEVRKDAISKSRNFMVRKSCDKKKHLYVLSCIRNKFGQNWQKYAMILIPNEKSAILTLHKQWMPKQATLLTIWCQDAIVILLKSQL